MALGRRFTVVVTDQDVEDWKDCAEKLDLKDASAFVRMSMKKAVRNVKGENGTHSTVA